MNNHALKALYKLYTPCRNQLEMHINCLDSLLPAEHKARDIWEFVNSMDCTPCYALLKTFMGNDGRPATSPQVLLALWIFSIMDGNISARKLARLCEEHNAYKWIAGGVPINRTMLAEFRTINPSLFESLLTNTLAVMLKSGLINDVDFSQDGTRIKASAGFNTYRRKETLEKTKEDLKEYMRKLRTEENPYDKSKQNKKQCIANERLKRVEEALKILEKETKIKKENGDIHRQPPSDDEINEIRASITDPTARKMKMGDNGFRLAYNVQLATGMNSRVIFGVDVVTTLDAGTSPKLMLQVHNRLRTLGMFPAKNWIGDSAYSGRKDVEKAAENFPNCQYYAPAKVHKGCDPKKVQKKDSEAVKKWRDLIDKDEVKKIYKLRCSTAEFSNAQMKQRGWREFMVRGLEKVTSSALLNVITQNISRYFSLRKIQLRVTA
jgi:transposase